MCTQGTEREHYNRAALWGKGSGHLGAQGFMRQSFWGAVAGRQGLGWGCHNGIFPGNRGGWSSYSHSRVTPEGRRPPTNVLRRAVSNNPPKGSHIRPRPAARGVAAPRRIPGHPRPPRPGVPDGGRPTARGASEARAGQPRLLWGERVHGGRRRRTSGPRRVASAGTAAGQRQGGARARRGGGAGARGHVGRSGSARSGGVGERRAERLTVPLRGQTDSRRRFPDNAPPGPKVSQRRSGDSVGTAALLADAPGAGTRASPAPPGPKVLGYLSFLYLAFYPRVSCTASCLSVCSCLLLINCTPTLETFGPLAMRPVQGTGIRGSHYPRRLLPLQFRS